MQLQYIRKYPDDMRHNLLIVAFTDIFLTAKRKTSESSDSDEGTIILLLSRQLFIVIMTGSEKKSKKEKKEKKDKKHVRNSFYRRQSCFNRIVCLIRFLSNLMHLR